MTNRPKVLVTGATGVLGKRLVKRLGEEGFPVRALVRKQSDVNALRQLGIELAYGDVVDESSVAMALADVDIVVHAAAGTKGAAKECNAVTIRGTQNVLRACNASHIKRLIYISSCSVYEVAGYAPNQLVNENAQLERFPERRGHYSAAKLHAEALVTEAMDQGRCTAVVLRLGTLYGPGAEIYTQMMGIKVGRSIFIVFGNGDSELPLLHVNNAVDAIVDCMGKDAARNQIFNVVDHDPVTKRMYMERVVKLLHPNARAMYCPMSPLLAITWLQEKVLTVMGKEPLVTVYRLLSSQKRVTYRTSKIENMLGWRSNISFEAGVQELLNEHHEQLQGSGDL